MARGRFISNTIAMDKKVNDLSDDTCRLLFTWLVTFADCEGRTYGDPAIIRSLVFPRRSDITLEQLTSYIYELYAAGLILLYESDGDRFIYFPNFEKHQKGLIKTREAASIIPEFTTDLLVTYSGVDRDLLTVKLSKDKDNTNTNGNSGGVFAFYESNIGALTPAVSDAIQADIDDYSEEWVTKAIEIAVKNEKRSLAYVEGILKRWKRDGFNTDNRNKNDEPQERKPAKVYQ